jgi:AcrR family transcriptional regulator
MQSETRTTRQQQALERREQIVETALHLFARQGFDGTSTKQIAQAAGITEGLIFHYFATKADLLTAVVETHHSFIGELRTRLSAASAEPAADLLPRLATAWLKTLRREREITLVLFSAAQTNRTVGDAFQALVDEGNTRLSAYLYAAVERGELRADLPVATSAHMFFASLIIFFLRHHHLPATAWETHATAFVHEMLSVWFDGACL